MDRRSKPKSKAAPGAAKSATVSREVSLVFVSKAESRTGRKLTSQGESQVQRIISHLHLREVHCPVVHVPQVNELMLVSSEICAQFGGRHNFTDWLRPIGDANKALTERHCLEPFAKLLCSLAQDPSHDLPPQVIVSDARLVAAMLRSLVADSATSRALNVGLGDVFIALLPVCRTCGTIERATPGRIGFSEFGTATWPSGIKLPTPVGA